MDSAVANSCSECEKLRARLAERDARVAELEAALADATRAAKRQAAPFSKGEPKKIPEKPGRKAGDLHGKHAHRPPPPPEEIHETLEAPLPEQCPHCGGALVEDEHVDEQFQTDLPTQPVRRKFRIHCGTCRHCKRRVRGRHELQTSDAVGAAQSQLGPNAQATVVYLNKHSGMSYGKIADFLDVVHGINFRPSTGTRIVLRAAERLVPTYEEIKQSMRDSKVIVPDETGWRIGGQPAWLHVAVGDKATLYHIDRNRSADSLEKVIGLDYSGIMAHDGFASYDRFTKAIHQQCVAHALARAQRLSDMLVGHAQLFPQLVMTLFMSALGVRDAFLARELTQDELDEAHAQHVMSLLDLTERPRANGENDRFARHLYNHWDHWFTFLSAPGLPATSNAAERALRIAILIRKMCGGNRTASGAAAQAILNSTIATCRQQKRSAFGYVFDAMRGVAGSILAAGN